MRSMQRLSHKAKMLHKEQLEEGVRRECGGGGEGIAAVGVGYSQDVIHFIMRIRVCSADVSQYRVSRIVLATFLPYSQYTARNNSWRYNINEIKVNSFYMTAIVVPEIKVVAFIINLSLWVIKIGAIKRN